MKNHGKRSVETWHVVDRFTMIIGKHENGKLRPGHCGVPRIFRRERIR